MRFYAPSASEFGAVPNHENKDKLGFVFLKVVQLLTAPLLPLLSQGLSGSFSRCLLVIANNVAAWATFRAHIKRGLENTRTSHASTGSKSSKMNTQSILLQRSIIYKIKVTDHTPTHVCDKMTNEIIIWGDAVLSPPTYDQLPVYIWQHFKPFIKTRHLC